MTDLKPCPFCGGNVWVSMYVDGMNEDSSIRYDFRVVCTKCDVKCDGYIRMKSENEIIDWWNRRSGE